MNIVILTHILIIILLLLETSPKLKLKDSIQLSVLTSSIVLLLSTLINNFLISNINTLVETSLQDPNSNIMYVLKPLFMMLSLIGNIIGKSNIPFFTQTLIMLLLYGFLKSYIRKIFESSQLIVPVGTYSPQIQTYTPAPYPTVRQQGFILGQEAESPSLADIEKVKRWMMRNETKNMAKKLSQKIVEGTKIGAKGTIEFIGENQKFKDDGEDEVDEVILPQSVESRVMRIIQQEDSNEGVSEEIMKNELKKKKEQEKEMTKQLAQIIRTNIDVTLSINDQNSAWGIALDHLQGFVMNYLQIPPEIAVDQNRYRVLQTLNMSKQGYFKFTVEFFFSSNTIYYFDVYVFNDGQVKVSLKNVQKY